MLRFCLQNDVDSQICRSAGVRHVETRPCTEGMQKHEQIRMLNRNRGRVSQTGVKLHSNRSLAKSCFETSSLTTQLLQTSHMV